MSANVTDTIDDLEVSGPAELIAEFKAARQRHRAAIALAMPALDRLVSNVLTQRSGQCYKMRDLLYSLYNGQPVTLSHICGLDFELRTDLCLVIQAWGLGDGDWEFFYDALKSRVQKAGQWKWFLEAEKKEES